ncbi:MAG: peptidylprolyl isomerase [bacterium]
MKLLKGLTLNGIAVSFSLAMMTFASLSTMAQQQPQIQASESVAATVNDHMISTFDVRQRMRLMLLTSGGRIPESAMPQLQQRALEDLIEEKLKTQEAERLEFDIDPSEVSNELGRIAASSRITPQQLEQQLISQGVAPVTVEEQIHARLVWQRLVAAKYRSRVRVSEDEIDDVLDRLRKDSSNEQFLVSEICLPAEDPSKVEEVRQAGMQIIQQMQNGAPFGALANQFSVCSTAANGGDLGWVRSGELTPELDQVLKQMKKGTVSIPTAHEGIVYIFAMRDKRAAATAGTPTYQIAYASAPLSIGEAAARTAFAKFKKSNACHGGELNIDLGADIGFSTLPPLPASEVEAPFRSVMASLERGETSEPIANGNYYHTMMLCEKDEGLGLPSRAKVKDRLSSQQLSLLSRRYLRDIRRDSSVEIFTHAAPATATAAATDQ